MFGSEARMRLSLVISCPPGANGTLKSTRIKTVLFLRSRSRIESLGINKKAVGGNLMLADGARRGTARTKEVTFSLQARWTACNACLPRGRLRAARRRLGRRA